MRNHLVEAPGQATCTLHSTRTNCLAMQKQEVETKQSVGLWCRQKKKGRGDRGLGARWPVDPSIKPPYPQHKGWGKKQKREKYCWIVPERHSPKNSTPSLQQHHPCLLATAARAARSTAKQQPSQLNAQENRVTYSNGYDRCCCMCLHCHRLWCIQ